MRTLALSLMLLILAGCQSMSGAPAETATVVSANDNEVILKTDSDMLFLRAPEPGSHWSRMFKRGDTVTLEHAQNGEDYHSIHLKNGTAIPLE